jgi:hypothetical protein
MLQQTVEESQMNHPENNEAVGTELPEYERPAVTEYGTLMNPT